jgi:magnesium transporter
MKWCFVGRYPDPRDMLVKPETKVSELMDGRLIALSASDPQEEAINIFRMNNRTALPVVDRENILLGIVTVDDILWIANEEYTEDIQKIGGTEAWTSLTWISIF